MNAFWNIVERWGYFPEEVNGEATRLLALFVLLLALVALFFWQPLLFLLPLGFFLRAWRGPQLDPFARLASRLSLSKDTVPGAPKRFAQIMGLMLTALLVLLFLLGSSLWYFLLAILVLLASAEAFCGYCLGCQIFALFIRRGWLREDVCARCQDITS